MVKAPGIPDTPQDIRQRNHGAPVISESQVNFTLSDDSVLSIDSIQSPTDDTGLKRTVGLLGGVSMIAGTMIGSGIFVSPKGVLEDTGSIGLCLIIWAACGILSMFGALAYAELGTMITKSGGEWIYILEGFGPLQRHVGALPAFLFSWVSVVVLKPSSLAIISMAFSEYIMSPFFDSCGPPVLIHKLLTAVTILFMSAMNIYSVKAANKVMVLFFLIKIFALVAIVTGGFYRMSQGDTKHLSTGFQGTVSSPAAIARAFYKGLWAYDGWNNLNYITEELKNPQRNIWLSICISIPLVTVIYILTNISYFTVLSTSDLLASNAVAVDWANLVLPAAAVAVTVCVAFSTFGAANGTLIGGSRLTYSAARGGHLMSVLSMIDVNFNSPSTSIVFTATVAILMTIPSDIFTLIDFFSFSAWIFYGFTMASLLVLRWKRPDLERPFKCPIGIPILVLLASIYLVFAPIIDSPNWIYLYAFAFILAGAIFYVPFVVYKVHFRIFDYFTLFIQKLMQIAPTDELPDE